MDLKLSKVWGYVGHDPFDGLVLPEWRKEEQRFFTVEEMPGLSRQPQSRTGRFTGWRLKRACGPQNSVAEMGDVDIDSFVIQVRNSVWRGKLQSVKSVAGNRCFAISPELAAHLGVQHGRNPVVQFMFNTSNGTPWDPNLVVKRKLYPLLELSGLIARAFTPSVMETKPRWIE